jgi:hypothetical protein
MDAYLERIHPVVAMAWPIPALPLIKPKTVQVHNMVARHRMAR